VPLLPIDLQILFTQSYQVGKDQAAAKELVPNAQAVQGSQLARQVDARDNKVNETQRQDQGADRVRKRNRREKQGKRDAPAKDKKKPSSGKKDVLSDPALGSHIDITS
jgi:hypothetical protein